MDWEATRKPEQQDRKSSGRLVISICIFSIACSCLSNIILPHQLQAQIPLHFKLDQDKLTANGIRVIEGKHINLYTDMPSAKDVDEMVNVFDQAVPQWCEYFEVEPLKVADWKINGFLIKDRKKCTAAGLLHDDLPLFLNGYQSGYQFWLFEQPSPFYRRHLFLHEGTHAFMNLILGGAGPPWYLEGMAELMACHQWKDGQLKIHHRIADRESSPFWGRVRVITEAAKTDAILSLEQIVRIQNKSFLRVEPYAWSWAANAFFDGHPECQTAFRDLKQNVTDHSDRFTDDFLAKLKPIWPEIREQWQLYTNEMDYGYDVARAAIVYRETERLGKTPKKIELKVDRGWQSSGLVVQAGDMIKVEAKGRYQIAFDQKPWWCEPNGVTIHYYQDKPLGALVYALSNKESVRAGRSGLLKSTLVGKTKEIEIKQDGTLFFRVNENPNALADNQGTLEIVVEKQDE